MSEAGVARGRIVVDGRPDRVRAPATRSPSRSLRAGESPGRGGTLCLAGDCGNCLATVDGVAYVRTCQTPARPGLAVDGHPAGGLPPLPVVRRHGPDLDPARAASIEVRRLAVDVAVVGGGAERARGGRDGGAWRQTSCVLDAGDGEEVVAIYAGPTVVVRTPTGCSTSTRAEIVVATGAAEIQPVCPGNDLRGPRHGARGRTAACGWRSPRDGRGRRGAAGRRTCDADLGALVRFEGRADDEPATAARSVARSSPSTTRPASRPRHRPTRSIVGLGCAPRDLLARMAGERAASTVVGAAAEEQPLPPPPTDGRRLPLHGHDRRRPRRRLVEGLHRARAAQAREPGLPRHVPGRRLPAPRPRRGSPPGPARCPTRSRPARRRARSRSAEAAADTYVDAFRRTPLHDEHLALGRADGPVRRLVAAVALRRRRRRVLGRPRGRLDRRRVARSASWSCPARTSSRPWSGSTRATSRTSSPAARATRCCSTSAATSWTTG